MSIGKLVLHPRNPESDIDDLVKLSTHLEEIGLLGAPLADKDNCFLVGNDFLQLVSFLGCSTDVCLTPDTASYSTDFCYLTITEEPGNPVLKRGRDKRPPTCPQCSAVIPDWQEQITSNKLVCKKCQSVNTPETLNWGKYAGYGRLFIEINNIFPGEARPVDLLFDSLHRVTGVTWRHFYLES